MTKNKIILASVLLYSLAVFLFFLLLISITLKILFPWSISISFIQPKDGFIYFLIIPVFLFLLAISYGLSKTKKWAYYFAIFLAITTFVGLLNSVRRGDPSWLNLLTIIPAIPLLFIYKDNNKIFK